ncbi:MAG: chemotaxis protein CheD [Sedimentisphaerales bacterium]|nr:chemotaxis protein CheD [Sedimentisphaerales bacterium]
MSIKKTVNISDAKVSDNPGDTLATYSLGSCIGVCVYDVRSRIGGMLHYQLPESKMDPERAKRDPFMFADTGMKILVDKMVSMGANKKRLLIKIAGGASMSNGPAGFDIGKRNYLALRKICWMNSLFIDKEDIGGSTPRNMYLDVADGAVTVKCNGSEKQL